MPLNDPQTGELAQTVYAAEDHNITADQPSFLDDVGNFATKAVPLTGIAALNSYANTAISIGNMFNSDSEQMDKVTVHDWVGDGDLNDYYNKHSAGIEAAGFVVGSLVPGMAGIKALKLAQMGETTGAVGRALGFFKNIKAQVVLDAEADIAAGPASLYGSLRASKITGLLAGGGDQFLQGIAFEAGSLAAQHGNPIVEQMSKGDIAQDMLMGGLINGVVGGAIDGIQMLYGFKKLEIGKSIETTGAESAVRFDPDNKKYLGGDRVAALVNSVRDIINIGKTGTYGAQRSAASLTKLWNDARDTIVKIAPDGDNAVGMDFIDNVVKPLVDKGDSATATNSLAGLSELQRIVGEAGDAAGDPGVLYVTRGLDKSTGSFTFNDIMKNIPDPRAKVNIPYKLRDPNSGPPSIASFADHESWDGVDYPLYKNAEAAFADDHDIFINKDLEAIVNRGPKSKLVQATIPGLSRGVTQEEYKAITTTGRLPDGSKPLLSGTPKYGESFEPGTINANKPLIINLKTGNVTETAVPVTGDYGNVRIDTKGVTFGIGKQEQRISHSLSNPLTEDTSTIEANSRYVWANSEDGYRIGNGDTIATHDIPVLERLYKEGVAFKGGWEEFASYLEKRGVSIDGMDMPTSADEMLSHIQSQKNLLLSDIHAANPNMSAEEAALRANVPQDYIDPMVAREAAGDPAKLIVDPATHETTNHVRAWYDIGNIAQNDGLIAQGMLNVAYRAQLIADAGDTTLAALPGVKDIDDFKIRRADDGGNPVGGSGSTTSNVGGAGPSFFGAARAAYGSLAEQTERIGRYINQWVTKRDGEVANILTAPANALKANPAAAAEASAYGDMLRSTGHKYMELPADLAAKHFPDLPEGSSVRVLQGSIGIDKSSDTAVPVWNEKFNPDGLKTNTSYTLGKEATDWWNAHRDLNDVNVLARNRLNAANGLTKKLEVGTDYAPKIDTTKYAHFAMIKPKAGTPFNDNGVSTIVARDAASLQEQVNKLGEDYDIFYKDDLAQHHMVLGDYKYDRNFNQSTLNSDLARRGVISNPYPSTSADTLINDFLEHHTAQNRGLIRDHVETANGQFMAEMKARSTQYMDARTSILGGSGTESKINSWVNDDPYNKYLQTMLNISPKENYRPWAYAQDMLEQFGDTAFDTVRKAFGAAQAGVLPLEEAGKVWGKFGISTGYKEAADMYASAANLPPPSRIVSKFITSANGIMGALVIKIDAFQQALHAITSPMQAMVEANSSLRELAQVTIPGTEKTMPSWMSLAHKSIGDMFDKDYMTEWGPMIDKVNAGRGLDTELVRQAIDAIALPKGVLSEIESSSMLTKGMDLATKLSGMQHVERFTNTYSALIGIRAMEAAGKTGQELEDGVVSFVNRVKANVVAQQRPVAFQGPLGSAIGLFQTYQFNVLQRLFKNVAEGDTKSLALFAGLQGSLFGLQSLPGFKFMNEAIGNLSGNPTHKDITSMGGQVFGDQLNKWILYGGVSNVLNASMYTRGDSNPRNLTLIPLNPLEWPAISGGIRLASSIWDMSKKIAEGGNIGSSLLSGLEHNGLSRPLQGLAQLAQGYSTTTPGKLISKVYPDNISGLNDLYQAGIFSRLAGSRPVDEAVIIEDMYRSNLYKAKDTARIESLGESVRSTMLGGQTPTPDQVSNFAREYANSGGRIDQFTKKMVTWSNESRVSVANEAFKHLSDPRAQRHIQVMGGVPLPDFRTSGFTQPNTVDSLEDK